MNIFQLVGILADQRLLAMVCGNPDCNSDKKFSEKDLHRVARDLSVCEDCVDKLMLTSVERGRTDESDDSETGAESESDDAGTAAESESDDAETGAESESDDAETGAESDDAETGVNEGTAIGDIHGLIAAAPVREAAEIKEIEGTEGEGEAEKV